MGDQLGSLEVGKIANVLVLSGDPLDFNSWVEKVYIDGILAYDRKKDVRLKTLIGEEKEEGDEETAPAENEEPEKKEAGEDSEKTKNVKESPKKTEDAEKNEPEDES